MIMNCEPNQICMGNHLAVSPGLCHGAAACIAAVQRLSSFKPSAHPILVAHVQIEVHPRYPQNSLQKLCADNDIAVVAYSSLGVGDLVQHPIVLQIANESQHTPAQVRGYIS